MGVTRMTISRNLAVHQQLLLPSLCRRAVRLSSFRACLAMRAVPYRKVHTEYKDGLFLLLPLHRARGIIEGQIHSGWMALKSVPTYFYIRSFTFYGFRLVVSSSTIYRAIL